MEFFLGASNFVMASKKKCNIKASEFFSTQVILIFGVILHYLGNITVFG